MHLVLYRRLHNWKAYHSLTRRARNAKTCTQQCFHIELHRVRHRYGWWKFRGFKPLQCLCEVKNKYKLVFGSVDRSAHYCCSSTPSQMATCPRNWYNGCGSSLLSSGSPSLKQMVDVVENVTINYWLMRFSGICLWMGRLWCVQKESHMRLSNHWLR